MACLQDQKIYGACAACRRIQIRSIRAYTCTDLAKDTRLAEDNNKKEITIGRLELCSNWVRTNAASTIIAPQNPKIYTYGSIPGWQMCTEAAGEAAKDLRARLI